MFFRVNYQLLWEQKDQQAYNIFPQILTHTELLPYIKKKMKTNIYSTEILHHLMVHILNK